MHVSRSETWTVRYHGEQPPGKGIGAVQQFSSVACAYMSAEAGSLPAPTRPPSRLGCPRPVCDSPYQSMEPCPYLDPTQMHETQPATWQATRKSPSVLGQTNPHIRAPAWHSKCACKRSVPGADMQAQRLFLVGRVALCGQALAWMDSITDWRLAGTLVGW